MSALIESLREHGRSDDAIIATRIGELNAERHDAGLGRAIVRFLELRAIYGGPAERGMPPSARLMPKQSTLPGYPPLSAIFG